MKTTYKAQAVHPIFNKAFRIAGKEYTLKQICMHPSSTKTTKMLKDPFHHLSIRQVEKLAELLGKSFAEMANKIRGMK